MIEGLLILFFAIAAIALIFGSTFSLVGSITTLHI